MKVRPLPLHREDVPGLTGLRFVAAFSVLLGHSLTTLTDHETPLGWIYWVKQSSGFGMTLFFVLSGFVIHYNYAALVKNEGLRGVGAYLWARFARLYPLFFLMLVVNIAVSSRLRDLLAGHPERFESTLLALPYYLTSIHSWFYVSIQGNALESAIGGGSTLTWSISTEWFFYFLYPCIAVLILKPRRSWVAFGVLLIWCTVWIVLSVNLSDRTPAIDAWAVGQFGLTAGIETHQQNSLVRWLLYLSPYLRMGEFVLGALLAQFYVLVRRLEVTKTEYIVSLMILLVATLSVPWIMHQMYGPAEEMNLFRKMSMNFALAPSVAAIIFCAARYPSMTAILNTRPLIALGEASYSIYLVHEVVLVTADRLLPPGAHSLTFDLAKLAAEFVVIFFVSRALYTFYETPSRQWLRKHWADRRKVAVLAATPLGLALLIAGVTRWG